MGTDIKNECLINGVQYKCRTCFDPGRTVYSLTDEASNAKTWGDLLKDIAQIKNEDELLPKTVCCKCQEKLKRSYDFILQIHNVNKKYSQLLANGKDPLQSEHLNENYTFNDCLAESAINLPLEQYMPEIKLEQEMVSSYNIDLDQHKLDEDNETKVENEDTDDPFTEPFDEEFKSASENERSPSESLNEDCDSDYRIEHSSSSSNESANDNISSQPDQRKLPQQPATLSYDDKIEKVGNSFLCVICKRTFTLRRYCRQHIKNIHKCLEHNISNAHSDDAVDPIVRRWLFGDHIYSKPTAWRLVQCKLCTTNFKTTKELRMHLESHSDVDTLHKLKLADNIVQYMFPNMYNLNSIKESICKDIRKKQWFKYYTVLNEYSYEMSISDTEVEDLEEEIAERDNRYKCAFCAKGFSYKHQVFSHLRDAHSKDEIPLKCSQCKLEFISIKMYKHHLETHCQNKHKNLLCAHCPGKFIWPENIKNHNCGTNKLATSATSTEDKHQNSFKNDIDGISYSAKPIIRCGLCAQSFKNIRHLRQHMPLHADGKTGIDFKDCNYVRQFENLDSIDFAKLQKQIQDAYTKSQISRYYQAVDKLGNEMDISDSDTDSSTEDTNEDNKEKVYACDLCKEKFKKRKYLLNHQQTQHPGTLMPFSCKECQKQFVSIHLLQQHLKRECLNEYRRLAPTCEFCNACLIWPSNMLKHKAIQHPLMIQPLSSMPTTTESVETATVENASWFHREDISEKNLIDISNNECIESKNLHNSDQKSTMENNISKLFTPTTENKFQCPSCGVSFSNNPKLTVHIKSRHTTKNPFKCNLCEMTFISLSDLQSHRLTHAGEHPFKCMFCEKSFLLLGELNNHKRIHKGDRVYQCSICQKKYKKSEYLRQHLRCHTGEKPYKCKICNKYFMCSAYLRRHCQLMGHTALWSEAELEPKVPEEHIPKAKHKSLCPFCGIYLSGNTSLTLHIRTHTGEKPFKCDFCEMAFVRRCHLKDHRRIHTDERPFKCPHCEKSFARQCRLKVHIRVHTGERPYQCTFCKKSFNKSDYLRLHERSHTGEKPFKCEVCGMAFTCGAYLKKHRISKGHPVEKIDSKIPTL